MNQTSYEQIIVAGIRRLSPERLREVADFVYFLRQREENDAEFQQLIEADLAELEESELKHLVEEFKDYQSRHGDSDDTDNFRNRKGIEAKSICYEIA